MIMITVTFAHNTDMCYITPLAAIIHNTEKLLCSSYTQHNSKVDSECQPKSESEKHWRGLIPKALGPAKTSLKCLK